MTDRELKESIRRDILRMFFPMILDYLNSDKVSIEEMSRKPNSVTEDRSVFSVAMASEIGGRTASFRMWVEIRENE